MKKINKFLLPAALAGSSLFALTAAVSCQVSKTSDDDKAKIKELQDKITELEKESSKKDIAIESIKKRAAESAPASKYGSTASSNIWNSLSADKHIATRQAYELAKISFDKMITQPNAVTNKVHVNDNNVTIDQTEGDEFIPVAFMDIDETVLNNFKYQNYLFVNQKTHSQKIFEKYTAKAISTEVQGALDFIRHVFNKGGVVMFNSNRTQLTQLEGTIQNLKNIGLEDKYINDFSWWMRGVDLSAEKPYLAPTRERNSKETRMNFINENKININGKQIQFKVVMRVGDDISDFNDDFTKSKSPYKIKLEDLTKSIEKQDEFGKLFFNMDTNVKGVKFNKTSETPSWTQEDHSESYIFIPGNATHGSWNTIVYGGHSLDYPKAVEVAKTFMWDGE
ncbi:acid phosphatase [Mycoplasma sp. Pen4]|uniref:HAD family acid phosphatase n=1 Tax=Mycoplasma sp. Pen4 TaxID=640330 RepID=UPI001654AE0A|nr:HAD family acid phosphatase [Mycoplasma sp. Pen4]QNM93483.1 acid phosphatase [Mycoplasma sp. Pen4]